MPVTGALLLTNPRRNRAGSVSSIIARLKNRKHGRKPKRRANSHGRRAHGKRMARALPRTAKGRFTKRRNYRIGKGGLGALAIRTNRKKNRSHKRRRNGFAVVRSNRGFGALAVRMNPGFSGLTSMVKRVPFLGSTVAPFIAPAAIGAIGITAVHYAMAFGMPFVLQFAPAALTQTVLPWIAPVGYTVGAAIVGTAIAKLPIPFVSPGTRKAIAVGAVVAGAAVDALRYLSESQAPMAGPQLYGEGLWQTVPFGSLSVGGRTYGETSDAATVQADYRDAELTDAHRCPSDLNPMEGQAALMGPSAWRRAFHPVKVTDRSGAELAYSRHAGRQGHQWGWLVKMLGFDRFSKLAALPTWQRVNYIRQLRQQAITLADSTIAHGRVRGELHGLILAQ
jgi:hypothetical protein